MKGLRASRLSFSKKRPYLEREAPDLFPPVDDEKFPVLAVAARGGAHGEFHQVREERVVDRCGLVSSDASPRADEVDELGRAEAAGCVHLFLVGKRFERKVHERVGIEPYRVVMAHGVAVRAEHAFVHGRRDLPVSLDEDLFRADLDAPAAQGAFLVVDDRYGNHSVCRALKIQVNWLFHRQMSRFFPVPQIRFQNFIELIKISRHDKTARTKWY